MEQGIEISAPTVITIVLIQGHLGSLYTGHVLESTMNLSPERYFSREISFLQGDINSSNSKYSPLCPPWSISVALLLFEASTSIFCVLIRLLHSLHTVCFRIFECQSYDPSWELLSCTLPSWFQSSNHFSKPLPRVLLCESGHSICSGSFGFKLIEVQASPGDEVWKSYLAVLNFGVLKRIQTPHSLLNFILGFQSR